MINYDFNYVQFGFWAYKFYVKESIWAGHFNILICGEVSEIFNWTNWYLIGEKIG